MTDECEMPSRSYRRHSFDRPPPLPRTGSLSGTGTFGNRRERLVAVGRVVAAAEVICALGRIGADHQEIVAADSR